MSKKLTTPEELESRRLRRLETQKRWRQNHPEKFKQLQDTWRKESNPTKAKVGYLRRKLKRMYDMSLDEFETLVTKQNGVCAICRRVNKSGKRLSVDHNHSTGKVRGLLCVTCNFALGYMLDNPALLRSAADYLEEHD